MYCSNIPFASSFGVYLSQWMFACSNYTDFINRDVLLAQIKYSNRVMKKNDWNRQSTSFTGHHHGIGWSKWYTCISISTQKLHVWHFNWEWIRMTGDACIARDAYSVDASGLAPFVVPQFLCFTLICMFWMNLYDLNISKLQLLALIYDFIIL